tara:strand:+ start:1101 stop:2309 length:1209 start_codon:yes stop_codon:yes gene_type:complete
MKSKETFQFLKSIVHFLLSKEGLSKLKSFLLADKKIKKLNKVDIVIYDSSNKDIFLPYLKNLTYEILDTRMKEINLNVLFRLFFSLKSLNMKNYTFEFLKRCNPKIILTFTDNNPNFYLLKKILPNSITIAIQNGMRTQDIFMKLKNFKNLEVDYIFTFGKAIQEKYKSSIKIKNLVTLGSFKNNMIKKSSNKRRNSIAFISTGFIKQFKFYQIDETTNLKLISPKTFFSPEYNLLPKLLKYCEANNKKLEIVGRIRDKKKSYEEYEWYKEILGEKNFTFFEFGKKYSAYQISDEVEAIVNIYSAFGLEVVARGPRIAFFHLRHHVLSQSYHCFWPGKINLKGDFWTDEVSQEEVERVLDYCLKANEAEWNSSIKKIMPYLITFDKDNETFNDTIKKILNKY